MKQSIAILLLNYNQFDETRDCLESLRKQVYKRFKIYLVDNGSNKEALSEFLSKYPEVILIRNERNLGVAEGRNVGLREILKSDYSYILILDNDTIIEDNEFLEKMLHSMYLFDTDILGPLIINKGKRKALIGGYKAPFWGFPIFRKYDMRSSKRPIPRRVDFISGCAQLVKAEVFRKIGLYDARFTPYGPEDIDFCLRASKAGFRVFVDPELSIIHISKGSYKTTVSHLEYAIRGQIRLLRRHSEFPVISVIFHVLYKTPKVLAQSLGEKNFRLFGAFLRGVWQGVKDNG